MPRGESWNPNRVGRASARKKRTEYTDFRRGFAGAISMAREFRGDEEIVLGEIDRKYDLPTSGIPGGDDLTALQKGAYAAGTMAWYTDVQRDHQEWDDFTKMWGELQQESPGLFDLPEPRARGARRRPRRPPK